MGKKKKYENEASIQVSMGAAETIKRLMEQQGMTQADLAERTHKSANYVNQALHPGGHKHTADTGDSYGNAPRMETYQTFASVLGVSLTPTFTSTPLPEGQTGRLTPKKGGKKKDAQK